MQDTYQLSFSLKSCRTSSVALLCHWPFLPYSMVICFSVVSLLQLSTKENIHNLKVESCVLFGGIFLVLQHLKQPRETVPKRLGGGVRLYRNLQQGAGSLNVERLLLIKETRYLKLRDLAYMYICRISISLCRLNIFWIYLLLNWYPMILFFKKWVYEWMKLSRQVTTHLARSRGSVSV